MVKKSHLKILVVDDEKIVLDFFGRLLRDKDCDLTLLKSGKEAVSLVKRRDFDLLFLDILLGDSNGLEIYRKIKKIRPGLGVVIITGEPSQAHLEGLDIRAFLYKPFKIRMILSELDKARQEKYR